MKNLLKEFESIISDSYQKLSLINEHESQTASAPGKWSKKEIIGHLIDSTANNHHRFVRAQLTEDFSFPGYEQNKWVAIQNYQNEDWKTLIELWKYYNLHLLHIVSSIPEEGLNKTCKIGDNDSVTLRFLFEDYLRHLKHHIEQIVGKSN